MVDYPDEWHNYMKDGRVLTFRIDTPPDIIKRAKEINAHWLQDTGTPYFYFEGEQEGPEIVYPTDPPTPETQKIIDEIREYIKSVAEGIKNGTLKSDDDDE